MQLEHFVNEDILYPKYFALTAKKARVLKDADFLCLCRHTVGTAF